uniref:Uncharacterized protein n=1 Tax=Chromera velia CCMP2878 TaxID=1169474 RepID=A0A0G4F074_9ALVE|eukprot:Cvel_14399.t1-p1 / transcript=Cvel_14399.t1 / gene=Cvel_14399 / organism=Chromera_velia_CCMP2878 / gene_product=hypothetical protein / transcript_product=hypothetical protein / location=Cvel_scaffold1022:40923-44983(+) / protein_length=926 / sequence_SO=supercontig / SO=protein_coding / is_pseudo=false
MTDEDRHSCSPEDEAVLIRNRAVIEGLDELKNQKEPFRFGLNTLAKLGGLGKSNAKLCFQLGLVMGVASLVSSVPHINNWVNVLEPSASSWTIITMVVVVQKTTGGSLKKAVWRLAGTFMASVLAFIIILIVRAIGNGEAGEDSKLSMSAVIVYFCYLSLAGVFLAVIQMKLGQADYVFSVAMFTLLLLGETAFKCGSTCSFETMWPAPVGRLFAIVLGVAFSLAILCTFLPATATQRMAEGIETSCLHLGDLIECMGQKLGAAPLSKTTSLDGTSPGVSIKCRVPAGKGFFSVKAGGDRFFRQLRRSLDALDQKVAKCRNLQSSASNEIRLIRFYRFVDDFIRRLGEILSCQRRAKGKGALRGCGVIIGGGNKCAQWPFRCPLTGRKVRHSHLDPESELRVLRDLTRLVDHVSKEVWRICFLCVTATGGEVRCEEEEERVMLLEGVESLCNFTRALSHIAAGRACAREAVGFLTEAILKARILLAYSSEKTALVWRERTGEFSTAHLSLPPPQPSVGAFTRLSSLLVAYNPKPNSSRRKSRGGTKQRRRIVEWFPAASGDLSCESGDGGETETDKEREGEGKGKRSTSTSREASREEVMETGVGVGIRAHPRIETVFVSPGDSPMGVGAPLSPPSPDPQEAPPLPCPGPLPIRLPPRLAAPDTSEAYEAGPSPLADAERDMSGCPNTTRSMRGNGYDPRPLEWIAELLQVAAMTGLVALKRAQAPEDLISFMDAVERAQRESDSRDDDGGGEGDDESPDMGTGGGEKALGGPPRVLRSQPQEERGADQSTHHGEATGPLPYLQEFEGGVEKKGGKWFHSLREVEEDENEARDGVRELRPVRVRASAGGSLSSSAPSTLQGTDTGKSKENVEGGVRDGLRSRPPASMLFGSVSGRTRPLPFGRSAPDVYLRDPSRCVQSEQGEKGG